MGGLSNQFSLHHPSLHPEGTDRQNVLVGPAIRTKARLLS
jgi:hypothetical protein